MFLLYKDFMRMYGIIRPSGFDTLKLRPTSKQTLPKNSVFHYIGEGDFDPGPDSKDLLFSPFTKPIMISHITEVGAMRGNPRKLSQDVNTDILEYRRKNPRFKTVVDISKIIGDAETLIVYNYSFIPRFYHYTRSIYVDYNKWYNQQAAFWENLGRVVKTSDRQHFFRIYMPDQIPLLAEFKRCDKADLSQADLEFFNNPRSYLLLELWKWLGERRENSLFTHVDPKDYHKVNLIFEETGRWFVINLGFIDSVRSMSKTEAEAALLKKIPVVAKRYRPEMIQKLFLRIWLNLKNVKSNPEIEEIPDQKNTKVGGEDRTKNTSDPKSQTDTGTQDTTTDRTGANGPDAAKSPVSTATKVTNAPIDNLKKSLAGKAEVKVTKGAVYVDDVDDTELTEIDEAIESEHNALYDQAESFTMQLDEEIRKHEEAILKAKDSIEIMNEHDTVAFEDGIIIDNGVQRICDKLAENNLLTAKEYLAKIEQSKTYKRIKMPGTDQTIEEFVKINPKDLEFSDAINFPDNKLVPDKSMLSSTLEEFDKKYIERVLERDVMGMVLNIQKAGYSLIGVEKEEIDSIMGGTNLYRIRIAPVTGAVGTATFMLPKLNKFGIFKTNGVKYRLRKQRGDLPIRKIAPDKIALTSYYGKIFVRRSPKRVHDSTAWLNNYIMATGLNPERPEIYHLQPSDAFDNLAKTPKIYSSVSMSFRGFNVQYTTPGDDGQEIHAELNFVYGNRFTLYGESNVNLYERNGRVIVGRIVDSDVLLVMDTNGMLYHAEKGKLTEFAHFYDFVGADITKAPVDMAVLRVMGKSIPIGVILGFQHGLTNLMQILGATPRRVPAGTRKNLEPYEYALDFADESLIFDRDDKKASLIMSGFANYSNVLKRYSVSDFDRQPVYLNLLESEKIGARYLREVDMIYKLFIESITKDLLIEMGEPTNMRDLFIRSCELLTTDDHPDELDPEFMRIKGYERFAGAVYSELVKSIRAHNARPGKSRLPVDLNPYAVSKNISLDSSLALVEELNPVENVKEQEAVTFSGTGGRSSLSMVKRTRIFNKKDLGTISEATKDSGDVGINTYTVANPQFVSLRGRSKPFDPNTMGPASLLSSTALLMPGGDRDDPKRLMFGGIQHAHGIFCHHYSQSMIRTGYDNVLPYRTTEMFCVMAKKPGKVVSVDQFGIVVEYKDGTTEGFELGRQYGSSGGLTIPHDLVTTMQAGQTFKPGDNILYNKNYFEPDVLDPKQPVWKAGIMMTIALQEIPITHEDSSAISKRSAELLSTEVTYHRDIVVDFEDSIRDLVKVGQYVQADDPLCYIEKAVTANKKLFDDATIDTLKIMGKPAPRAKTKGVVERIEVLYHGDKEDMSESLRALADASDRLLRRRARSAGKKPHDGNPPGGFRVDGNPVLLDNLVIRIHISKTVGCSVGDKGVFGNQLKTVIGEVYEEPIYTESGREIDGRFGQKAVDDRIVYAVYSSGTGGMLMEGLKELTLDIWDE